MATTRTHRYTPSVRLPPRPTVPLLVLASLCAMPARGDAEEAGAPELVTLRTRGDVHVSYLLLAEGTPAAVALLFSGGDGVVGVERLRGAPRLDRGNFLVRSRELLRSPELAVAVLDAPSDRWDGMDDAFRSGKEHATDVGAVVADLRSRFPAARLFLVGTSAGTVSAAYAGAALGASIDGVVLTSSVLRASRFARGLEGFDLRSIRVPLLLVHHADDACPLCPYPRALALGRHVPLITVHGGRPPESDACGPLAAHGYYGREAETTAAIRAWILGQPFPSVVE